MNSHKPFKRQLDPVEQNKSSKRLRLVVDSMVIILLIFLPTFLQSILTVLGVIDPSFNQWFAMFTLVALGIFIDWIN